MTSGIYLITCTASNKRYVGSTRNIVKRWSKHRRMLETKAHDNIHMQNSWNKHGKESFVFEVLEYVAREFLVDREIYWINFIKPEYNLALPNESQRGWTYTEETLKRMSAASKNRTHPPLTEQHRQRIADAHTGKKHSLESRLEMSRTRKGKPGYPKSDEARQKISKARKGQKNSPAARKKISQAMKGKPWSPARRAAHKIGRPAWNRGMKMTTMTPDQNKLDTP